MKRGGISYSDASVSQFLFMHMFFCFKLIFYLRYLPHFFSFAEHDDALDFFFPDHPPEVIDSVWEGALSGDVCAFLPVTLCENVW